ncbi:MAG: hypothetical protein JXM70_02225, partial [Pirellulales bacterium]|nr:hypothetical protein [Pirellulales bacterium]
YQPESRMREIRKSGSEGGGLELNRAFLPPIKRNSRFRNKNLFDHGIPLDPSVRINLIAGGFFF